MSAAPSSPEPAGTRPPRSELRRVVVVGFGLIGASVGRALVARGVHVSAVDVEAVIGRPAAGAAASEVLDTSRWPEVEERLRAADLAVLATPVRTIEALLPELLPLAAAVTDCGSTKRSVLAVAARSPERARFVGGHPMAGGPRGGVDHASADLFVGRTWIVCPELAAPQALGAVDALIDAVGARRVSMAAASHDRAVARTSHVTQLLGSLLQVMAAEPQVRAAAGPAFERVTQSAGGEETMWRDILDTNADEIAVALREIAESAEQIAAGLAARPVQLGAALALLERARRLREDEAPAGERTTA